MFGEESALAIRKLPVSERESPNWNMALNLLRLQSERSKQEKRKRKRKKMQTEGFMRLKKVNYVH